MKHDRNHLSGNGFFSSFCLFNNTNYVNVKRLAQELTFIFSFNFSHVFIFFRNELFLFFVFSLCYVYFYLFCIFGELWFCCSCFFYNVLLMKTFSNFNISEVSHLQVLGSKPDLTCRIEFCELAINSFLWLIFGMKGSVLDVRGFMDSFLNLYLCFKINISEGGKRWKHSVYQITLS